MDRYSNCNRGKRGVHTDCRNGGHASLANLGLGEFGRQPFEGRPERRKYFGETRSDFAEYVFICFPQNCFAFCNDRINNKNIV